MPDYCDTRGAYAVGHRMTERKRETGKTSKLPQGNLAMGADFVLPPLQDYFCGGKA